MGRLYDGWLLDGFKLYNTIQYNTKVDGDIDIEVDKGNGVFK